MPALALVSSCCPSRSSWRVIVVLEGRRFKTRA